ncbi:MAG: hypothetical protein AB2406_07590 [Pseudomonas aeruginosa]
MSVGVQRIAFGVLVVEDAQIGAFGQGSVVAGIDIHGQSIAREPGQQAEQRGMQQVPGALEASSLCAHFHIITFIVFVYDQSRTGNFFRSL